MVWVCPVSGWCFYPFILYIMPVLEKTLINVEENLRLDHAYLDGSVVDAGGDHDWSIRKDTLRGGVQEGIDIVEINNGSLCIAVLPTRGMGIWKARSGSLALGWNSPVKDPVHPAYVDLQENGGIGWLRGFNEWIVRCGLNSMGAPGLDTIIDNNGNESEVLLPLHGRIANTPARKVSVEITSTEIILRGEVEESMLFGPVLRLNTEIRTAFGSDTLTISDTVTNMGHNPAEHALLYHINYGEPILEKGARIVAPFKEVAPRDPRAAEGIRSFDRFEAPTPGFVEQAYFCKLAGKPRSRETTVLLRNAKGTLGSAIRYGLRDFPAFTLWKNTAAREDGYVTGLEPATAYPTTRRFERSKNRMLTLKAGESRSTILTVEALSTSKAVRAVESEIKALQKTVKAVVHAQPVPEYSDI